MKKTTTPAKSDSQKILAILANADRPVTASMLKNRARLPYDSVSKRIHDLREQGHNIRTITRKGVDGAKSTTYTL